MIVGKISKNMQNSIIEKNDVFKKIFNYLENNVLVNLPLGIIEIDDSIFGYNMNYKTSEFDINKWEAHNEFIDIHYILEGSEKVFITDVENIEVTQEYNKENDVLIGKNNNHCYEIKLDKGRYLILFPGEAHQTGIKSYESCDVKKIVFKIRNVR